MGLSKCFETLLFSWGGDTPPEAIWAANEFLNHFCSTDTRLQGLEFLEEGQYDYANVNSRVIEAIRDYYD